MDKNKTDQKFKEDFQYSLIIPSISFVIVTIIYLIYAESYMGFAGTFGTIFMILIMHVLLFSAVFSIVYRDPNEELNTFEAEPESYYKMDRMKVNKLEYNNISAPEKTNKKVIFIDDKEIK